MTAWGTVPARELGMALPHEHMLVDFIGAEHVSADRYDRDEVFEVMFPLFQEAANAGITAFFEGTPAYLGRDPVLITRLSMASGIHIVTNTGYYGAAKDKYIPAHAYEETAQELADRWIKEWKWGIDGTNVRPGFIKIGVDPGPLSAIDGKLVTAAAITHLATGLTIACHISDARAAMEVLNEIMIANVDPSALIFVHADGIRNIALQAGLAAAGAWIEYDSVQADSVGRHVRMIKSMMRGGYGDRLLLSHDAGWYSVGEPKGGQIRPFIALMHDLLPALKADGVGQEQIDIMMVDNPARAYAVRIRELGNAPVDH